MSRWSCEDEVMDPLAVKYVITSPLSLGRVMWWYAEDELWPTAIDLSAAEVADLAPRFAELRATPIDLVELLWPGAPSGDAYLVLGTIELLEGHPRPAARRHRRGGPMPDVLEISEDQRWRDPVLAEVLRLVDERAGFPSNDVPVWRRHRLHGRYAAG